ncbi:hypothetical protein OESDEN_08500 [Oesophagostomum dentatum]|uniref:Uncharacterized protein n=1 Tax=Oesophagostomum dentatum TaxID=61180 RepID=A0A0B1T8H9_OESDE|nr:hypothetical protein OESDEN_08500 [Oesophagostomum dentatum]
MDWEMDHDSLISAGAFDIVHKLVSFKPIGVVASIAKEVQQTNKISHGVVYAAKLYPESYMFQVLVGVANGAGSRVLKIVEQVVRGTCLQLSMKCCAHRSPRKHVWQLL